jgi:hypothetical protein
LICSRCFIGCGCASGDGCRSRAFTPDRSSARCIDWQKLLAVVLIGCCCYDVWLLLRFSGDGCRSRAFTPDRSSARCIDRQKLRLQELLGADQQQQGKVPRSVEVRLYGT